MSEKPKRLFSLGWIEVVSLRPRDMDPTYAGKGFLNLDLVKRIQFFDNRPGVAVLHYPDGSTEALEEENHSRLLKAVESAQIE